MLLREGNRHWREQGFVDLARVDRRDDRESLLVAERVEDLVRVQEALLDEDIVQGAHGFRSDVRGPARAAPA